MARLAPIVPGQRAPRRMLVNLTKLVSAYYTTRPQKPVEFGTSGHRGSSLKGSFNEAHILAVTQAICEYRQGNGITGPLYIGFDTHALSVPAFRTALEVLAANDVEVVIHKNDEYTPTPVISRMILKHNAYGTGGTADGIVISSSHNGPEDGGLKYNPPHGGPADVDITKCIEDRANQIMKNNNFGVNRIPYEKGLKSENTHQQDLLTPFVDDLALIVDMDAIRSTKLRIGVDPMGGCGIRFWGRIAESYDLDITVVNNKVEPDFRFMTVDWDGKIRMDCSSPDAMAGLIGMKDQFDIAFGNDPDCDRHGIVTPDGLMNPNHYLSVAIWYLARNRPNWSKTSKFGKTLVSSSMIDKVVAGEKRELYEVPVGFKWFVQGLLNGELAFGGEESAGASLLQMDGNVWTTDKDGFALTLLAAEILAKTGKTPSQIYNETLVTQYGEPFYRRADGPITDEQRAILKALTPSSITATTVAGLRVQSIVTSAPGNDAPLGGVKVVLEDSSWFAVRPSGTEPKMKVYVESYGGEELWSRIHQQAAPLIFGSAA